MSTHRFGYNTFIMIDENKIRRSRERLSCLKDDDVLFGKYRQQKANNQQYYLSDGVEQES